MTSVLNREQLEQLVESIQIETDNEKLLRLVRQLLDVFDAADEERKLRIMSCALPPEAPRP